MSNFVKTDGSSIPTQDNAFDIGSEESRFNDIYAQTFQGVAILAENLAITGNPGDVLVYNNTSLKWTTSGAYATKAFVSEQITNINNDVQVNLEGYVTELELETAIQDALQVYDPNIDLTPYALKTQLFSGSYNDLSDVPVLITSYNDLTDTPTIPVIPTNISEFSNDSGYLTEHQDLSAYALKTELFSADYNDLTNTPTIPSLTGYATETYVNQQITTAMTEGEVDLSDYYTKSQVDTEIANISLTPGPQGDVGPQGIQGIAGATGPAGPAGATGAQGLQGLKGDKGDTGDQGPQGIQGPQGLKGDKGDTGDVGPVGPMGPAGATGAVGAQGIQGPEGPEGPAGSGLTNIQDETYGVSVTGKMAISTIDIGSGINASPGATFDLQGTTINFGSATIMGGNAFKDTINNHIWAGSTEPTDGHVLSWNASLLSGAGDYEWIALSSGSGGSSYNDTDVATYLNGNLDTSIIPDTNAQYDLGNAEYKIRHLFLSDNSIYMGDAENTLRTSGNTLLFNGEPVQVGAGGEAYDQSLNTTDDVDFASVTTQALTVTGVGDTTITSGADVQLDSPNRVGVLNSPFRLAHMTNAERDAIIAQDGDMIYNVEDMNFQVYTQGSWFRLSLTPIV